MIATVVLLLTLTTYDYDTGTKLAEISKQQEWPGPDLMARNLCRILGVNMAREMTKKFTDAKHTNVSTNVVCQLVPPK